MYLINDRDNVIICESKEMLAGYLFGRGLDIEKVITALHTGESYKDNEVLITTL